MSQQKPTTKNRAKPAVLVAPVNTQAISWQAAMGCLVRKGGNRWRFTRSLRALYRVGLGVFPGGLGGKLSAESHNRMEEELAAATSSLRPLSQGEPRDGGSA